MSCFWFTIQFLQISRFDELPKPKKRRICLMMAKYSESAFLLHSQPVLAHPLLQTISNDFINFKNETKEKEEKDDKEEQFFDPLGASGSQKFGSIVKSKEDINCRINNPKIDETGPLDNTLLKCEKDEEIEWPITNLDPLEKELIGFKPWVEIRKQILDQFNTADKLTLESSFLTNYNSIENGNNANAMAGNKQKQLQQTQRINAAIKANKRSTSGKQFASDQQMAKFYELTQNEWCRKMVELRKKMILKWREGKRLDCIKLIAELLVQLCGTICSAQFYPAQFVHVTDLLDLFGWLVWQRLSQFAQEERRNARLGQLPATWTTNDILGETRLKARNWFGKINQTVQMLAPRIYMLAAILPCQRFMDPWPSSGQENLLELCRGAQQIQHPLISSYLRCYLCRVGIRVQPTDRAPHWKCLNDWLQTFTQQPISFLWPAMEWVIQCVAYGAVNYEDLHPLWEYCKRMDKRPVVLVPMLNSLSRLYLGEHSLEACRIVTGSELVTGEELCALGRNLLESEIPHQALKPILRSSWKCILRLGSLKEYLSCCEFWCQFVVRHFTANEIQVMLENMLRKLQNSNHELYIGQLLSILSKIFLKSREVRSIFGMEIFAKFFDIFRSAPCPIRVQASQLILESIIQKHQCCEFTNVNIAYQILSVCQLLHDSIELSAPSPQISEAILLINSALDRVDLRADPDQCLAFLVSCRADLSNWDALQKCVIRRVQSFSLHIVRSIRYSSSRAAFLQGCLANLFISIPSLSNPFERIELSLQSAQIALAAFAFLHVDSFVEFATDEFTELPLNALNDSSQKILQIGKYYLACLSSMIIGANEDHGGEYGLEKTLDNFQRFLQKILCFKLPSPSSPSIQHDRLDLLANCLQFIFTIQPKGFAEIQSNNFEEGEIAAEELIKASFEFGKIQSKMNLNGNTKLREKSAEMVELFVDGVEGDFMAEKDSEKIFNLGMELLELIGLYGGDVEELSPRLRGLAKIIYKKIRRKPMLAKRIERLKALNNRAAD